jgi:hypothetical protein
MIVVFQSVCHRASFIQQFGENLEKQGKQEELCKTFLG